jgi:hypothetical protein
MSIKKTNNISKKLLYHTLARLAPTCFSFMYFSFRSKYQVYTIRKNLFPNYLQDLSLSLIKHLTALSLIERKPVHKTTRNTKNIGETILNKEIAKEV